MHIFGTYIIIQYNTLYTSHFIIIIYKYVVEPFKICIGNRSLIHTINCIYLQSHLIWPLKFTLIRASYKCTTLLLINLMQLINSFLEKNTFLRIYENASLWTERKLRPTYNILMHNSITLSTTFPEFWNYVFATSISEKRSLYLKWIYQILKLH